MNIANEIKDIKHKTGSTARALAALCSVTEQTMWNWIRGDYIPPADKMDLLREFFNESQSRWKRPNRSI